MDAVLSYWNGRDGAKPEMQDAFEAGDVQIQISHAGKLWINIDGKCALRIGSIRKLALEAPKMGGEVRIYPEPEVKKPAKRKG
jgi:hypothetical protein